MAVDAEGSVIGSAVAWVVDGEGHLDELAVTPEHGRRGLDERSSARLWLGRLPGPSVSDVDDFFRDVPWNAPYYEKLGFRVVTALTPALQELLNTGATWGLDPSLRVVMRRSLIAERR